MVNRNILIKTQKALSDCFDRDSLRIFLREKLNKKNRDYCGENVAFPIQINALVNAAKHEGWLEELIDETIKERPKVQEFKDIKEILKKNDRSILVEIQNALGNSFNPNSLELFLNIKLNKKNRDYCGENVAFPIQINALVNAAKEGGWLEKLIDEVIIERPTNQKFRDIKKMLDYDRTIDWTE